MKTNNKIIIGIITIALLTILIYTGLTTQTTNNNTTNNTEINITVNNTNNTTDNQTSIKTSSPKKSESTNKSSEPEIISDEIQYNYQRDDGSYYRQVEYADGNFRQIDTNGKIIGSSFENDHVDSPSME